LIAHIDDETLMMLILELSHPTWYL